MAIWNRQSNIKTDWKKPANQDTGWIDSFVSPTKEYTTAYRITQAGDYRITQAGDRRIIPLLVKKYWGVMEGVKSTWGKVINNKTIWH